MVRCSREVLFSVRVLYLVAIRPLLKALQLQAFERLIDLRVFLAAAVPAASIAREFALHRSAVDRFVVKAAVEKIGQLNLKKWLTKT